MTDYRKILNKVGVAAGVLTLGAIGGGMVVLERDGDSYARSIVKIELEIARLTSEFHKKERACAVLEAVIATRDQYHEYYKPTRTLKDADQ